MERLRALMFLFVNLLQQKLPHLVQEDARKQLSAIINHVDSNLDECKELTATTRDEVSELHGDLRGFSVDVESVYRAVQTLVPIGGCYRLIDVPMSNCINSGINKIFILTQFNSASLNRHLAHNLGNGVNFGDGFVEIMGACEMQFLFVQSQVLGGPPKSRCSCDFGVYPDSS